MVYLLLVFRVSRWDVVSTAGTGSRVDNSGAGVMLMSAEAPGIVETKGLDGSIDGAFGRHR